MVQAVLDALAAPQGPVTCAPSRSGITTPEEAIGPLIADETPNLRRGQFPSGIDRADRLPTPVSFTAGSLIPITVRAS